MTVTKDQAHALATLAVACRPHGAPRWDAAGVVAAIGKVKHLTLADVMLAVARAADDRDLDTPAPIGNPRAHCWRERATDRPADPEPFDRRTFCATCGDPEPRCRTKWAGDHAFEPIARAAATTAPKAADWADYARQAVGDAKAAPAETHAPPEHEPNPHVQALRAQIGADQ